MIDLTGFYLWWRFKVCVKGGGSSYGWLASSWGPWASLCRSGQRGVYIEVPRLKVGEAMPWGQSVRLVTLLHTHTLSWDMYEGLTTNAGWGGGELRRAGWGSRSCRYRGVWRLWAGVPSTLRYHSDGRAEVRPVPEPAILTIPSCSRVHFIEHFMWHFHGCTPRHAHSTCREPHRGILTGYTSVRPPRGCVYRGRWERVHSFIPSFIGPDDGLVTCQTHILPQGPYRRDCWHNPTISHILSPIQIQIKERERGERMNHDAFLSLSSNALYTRISQRELRI